MSLIANLPTAPTLETNYLLIIESRDNENNSIETQKTTLKDIYDWLNNDNRTYNIKTDQIEVQGSNLKKTINDNIVTIDYEIPDWKNGKTYNKGEVVRHKNCLYICYSTTIEEPSNSQSWYQVGYQIGRHLTLDENNVLSGLGIDNWTSGTLYYKNDFVVYNKRLYQCLVENNDENWNESNWLNIGEGNGIIPYQSNKAYDEGAIVNYQDRLYKRLSYGVDSNWIPSHWVCISNGDYSQVYIKYSHNIPTSNAELKDEPDDYLGIYVGKSEKAPTSYSLYNWYKIKGEDGYVNVEANTVVIELTLKATDWSNTIPYVQTISNNLLKADMYPLMDVLLSDNEEDWQDEINQYSHIERAVCEDNQITFYCGEVKPTRDIKVKLRINGDVNQDSFVTKQEFNNFKNMVGNINELLETTLEGN